MGGHLNITSEVGKGTVATIELDVMAPQEPPPTAAAATYPSSTVEMPFDLMYAEDNEVNAELVRQVMRLRPSVQLRIASSGGEALEMAREEPPELMLVDMHLGDMTGLELTRELRADPRTRHIELVALSADALPEQIDAAKAVGFKVYLTKPVDFSQLLQLIDERLQAR
jgi:CheY-like chemotaxis protein